MLITFQSHEALDYIKCYLPENPIVIEAGAFDGNDTIKMSYIWPEGTIHSFEPVPEIYVELKNNTKELANVHCYPIALSNKCGIATMHLSEKPNKPGQISHGNSLLKPKDRLEISTMTYPKSTLVPTTTLDLWAQQEKIEQIDFMWLDLQGHQLDVLKASPNTLKKVRVIFTEVEFIQAYEGQPQYLEVRKWLESKGFEMVAKDFTEKPKSFFGNALFVRR